MKVFSASKYMKSMDRKEEDCFSWVWRCDGCEVINLKCYVDSVDEEGNWCLSSYLMDEEWLVDVSSKCDLPRKKDTI